MRVVGAAICAGGRVLVARRPPGPGLAGGRWEFPGGKVEAGEDDRSALARECVEELGVAVRVGRRLGPPVPVADGAGVLLVYLATVGSGRPRPLAHTELRWVDAGGVLGLDWVPADRPLLPALVAHLVATAAAVPPA